VGAERRDIELVDMPAQSTAVLTSSAWDSIHVIMMDVRLAAEGARLEFVVVIH
jgi:hypothetical protein